MKSLPGKLYLASGNGHKAEELSKLLAAEGVGVEVLSARELGGMPDVEENALTFEGNGVLKALALYPKVPEGCGVLADDSGLEVAFLKGAPGVRSARYAGENATDADNRRKLLQALQGVSPLKRRAAFRCCLVLIDPQGEQTVFNGISHGVLLNEERGEGGFGYDSLFVPEGDQRTYAEMTVEEKGKTSHRAKAVRQLVEWWKQRQAEEAPEQDS